MLYFQTDAHDAVQFIVIDHFGEQDENGINQLEMIVFNGTIFIFQCLLKVVQIFNLFIIQLTSVEALMEELEQLFETVKRVLVDVLQILKLDAREKRFEALHQHILMHDFPDLSFKTQ